MEDAVKATEADEAVEAGVDSLVCLEVGARPLFTGTNGMNSFFGLGRCRNAIALWLLLGRGISSASRVGSVVGDPSDGGGVPFCLAFDFCSKRLVSLREVGESPVSVAKCAKSGAARGLAAPLLARPRIDHSIG